MKRTFCYIAVLCLIPPLSRAMFCNTSQGSNGWIEQGMSQQDVISACGQPTSTAEIEKTNNRLDATQYWNYQGQSVQLVPQSSWPAPTPYGATKTNNTDNALVVEINNNVVSSLATNGKLVSSGNCPNGGMVRVGDSANRVVSSCGTATQVSYQYQKNNSVSPPTTQWTYQLQGGRTLTIQFQQGVVSELNQ